MLCMGFAPTDVGKMLPSTTYSPVVPQTWKSLSTTLSSRVAPILLVACMWAEVTIERFEMKCNLFPTISACSGLVRTDKLPHFRGRPLSLVDTPRMHPLRTSPGWLLPHPLRNGSYRFRKVCNRCLFLPCRLARSDCWLAAYRSALRQSLQGGDSF